MVFIILHLINRKVFLSFRTETEDIKYPKFERFVICNVCILPEDFGMENKAIKS